MISDDEDFKAGLEMAKEAEKRAARARAKRAAPKTTRKTAKTAKKAVKKAAPGKKAATAKTVRQSAPKAAAEPVAAPALPVLKASLARWDAGLGAWRTTGTKARDAYVETGRLALRTALALGRRNLALQSDLVARGLSAAREFRA